MINLKTAVKGLDFVMVAICGFNYMDLFSNFTQGEFKSVYDGLDGNLQIAFGIGGLIYMAVRIRHIWGMNKEERKSKAIDNLKRLEELQTLKYDNEKKTPILG